MNRDLRADVARDLSRSARVFSATVWPYIAPVCGGGELVPVEGVTATGMARTLDVLAGIDAWQTLDAQGVMRGIASRVQWILPGRAPFNTFTIRVKRASGAATEFDKRVHALEQAERGWLYPTLTVQAYVRSSDDALLSWAVADTGDLYAAARMLMARAGHDALPVYDAQRGYGKQFAPNAQFLAMAWTWLAYPRCRIVTWRRCAAP